LFKSIDCIGDGLAIPWWHGLYGLLALNGPIAGSLSKAKQTHKKKDQV
jgi:hypothetical protein